MGDEEERFARSNCKNNDICQGTKVKVRVGVELSKELWVQVDVHQGYV